MDINDHHSTTTDNASSNDTNSLRKVGRSSQSIVHVRNVESKVRRKVAGRPLGRRVGDKTNHGTVLGLRPFGISEGTSFWQRTCETFHIILNLRRVHDRCEYGDSI